MHTFYQWLKTKKSRKSKNGEAKPFGTAHLNKIMTHIKAYVKWLSDNAKIGKLVPADVPTCKVTDHRIAYLSKEEMSMLMQHLEQEVSDANSSGNKHRIYSAYLWRAVIRMLYTAGTRNCELR